MKCKDYKDCKDCPIREVNRELNYENQILKREIDNHIELKKKIQNKVIDNLHSLLPKVSKDTIESVVGVMTYHELVSFLKGMIDESIEVVTDD